MKINKLFVKHVLNKTCYINAKYLPCWKVSGGVTQNCVWLKTDSREKNLTELKELNFSEIHGGANNEFVGQRWICEVILVSQKCFGLETPQLGQVTVFFNVLSHVTLAVLFHLFKNCRLTYEERTMPRNSRAHCEVFLQGRTWSSLAKCYANDNHW